MLVSGEQPELFLHALRRLDFKICIWLRYIYVKLFEFWGLVIQVFQMQMKGFALGGMPFLTDSKSKSRDCDKAYVVNVVVQGIISWVFLSRDSVSSKFLSQRCFF